MVRNTDEFLQKINKIYGNKLDFSKSIYKGINEDVVVICPIHGEFYMTPKLLYYGRGCPKCAGETKKRKTKSTEQFIQEANLIHDYKYCYNKTKYIQSDKKVVITCPIHGDFEQRASSHLSGCGCPKCGTERGTQIKKKSTEQFIKDSKTIHGNKYNYNKTNYINAYTKVIITCPKHGDFEQTPNSHLKGRGCPKCNQSHGEEIIENWLKNNNISYNHNYLIKTDSSVRKSCNIFVDFYIPCKNLFIEYNGKQHYVSVKYFGGDINFKQQINRDNFLKEYCQNNNINLLIIDYTKSKNDIIECLKKQLQ